MAGHSQFKNIMHRKGRQDAAKSKVFSKLAREITVAAKTGMPDVDMNPRLRLAVQNARAQSMPKDNIQRAINKATGGDGESYDEVRYEGYGPGGVALIVEALTDNRNRTASNVRAAFTKAGGALGETGSVAFMFERVGEIFYTPDAGDAEKVMEAAIEAGAQDVQSDEDGHTIICAFEDIGDVTASLERSLGEAETVNAVWRPQTAHAGRRGKGAVDPQADLGARRRRRRAERLRQFRGRRRNLGPPQRGVSFPAVPKTKRPAGTAGFFCLSVSLRLQMPRLAYFDLKRETRPPRSTSDCWPPVQAGCEVESMSRCSVSPSAPQVERVSYSVPSVMTTLMVW